MTEPAKKLTYLERAVKALTMAAPNCLGARFEDLAHCVEASIGGAGALKKHRIEARPLPCAFVAHSLQEGGPACILSLGFDAKSMYAWMLKSSKAPPPPYEEWKAATSYPETDAPIHMIIEAKHCGKRVLIDLTAGQVRAASGGRISVPNTIIHYGDGWPRFELGVGGSLIYGPSPIRETTRAAWRDYQCPGLVADFSDVMAAALEGDLDPNKLRARTMPTEYEHVWRG